MRSLTGFGVGYADVGGGRIVADVRSVNHRFLEIRSKLPPAIADLALHAEQVLRDKLRRGRVDLLIRAEGSALPATVLDRDRARRAFAELRSLRDELSPGEPVPLALLGAVPDLFTAPSSAVFSDIRDAIRAAVERATAALDAMREREGAALGVDLAERITTLRRLRQDVAEQVERFPETARAKLQERLERLIGPSADATARSIDPGRLAAEVAILADRGDVSEELVRLASHFDHWDAIVNERERSAAIGRRLDFLLQEMVRETNTLGAKAQDASVSQRVVSMKAELERLREQVQNVE